MAKYILNINKQDSLSEENYEIHNEETCAHLPNTENRRHIGYFSNCKDEIIQAKIKYPEYAKDIDGCFWCSRPCHTQ